MSIPDKVNPQVLDAIRQNQVSVFGTSESGNVSAVSGRGKAYQSVAQSTAIAIQDATDSLRNISTISTTAIGAALAEWMVTQKEQPSKAIIDEVLKVQEKATLNFEAVGLAAISIADQYPSS